MNDLKHNSSSRLLWVDLEMTGLDVKKDRIIEVAAIVTDFEFKEIATYESVIYQNPKVIASMNDWSKEHHKASGLTAKINDAPKEERAKKEIISFIKHNFKEPAVLAGNSVHNDMRFIKEWWPIVEPLLHYRMLDVSAFKIVMQNKYHIIYNKKETHRALEDIRESITELKFYLSYFKKK
ncbi:MAG: oligoribonuclease [Candidatus Saccharibacteria bacterium]